ncbi:restriction endonuclease subunit S [Bifidobacterium merycicum]|uniref:restriction endonuclease subunit S n=1 Tax=Bifidobacterium merycicum TaxID=78345 RepID=UPI0023F190F4|nr:restriction endonuclease subunit S [Bifidobacterium merycicum]
MMVAPKLRFKADDGSDFPDWEDKTLGELFHISAGGDIDKNNCAAKQSEDYPYPVYANALVNNGTYGYANYYKIDGDTFTVTGRGDVGHAVARHCMYVPIVRLLVCQPNMDDDVDFFAEQINYTRVFIESTGVPQLTAPQLSKIKVKRPTLPEQRKIADLLSAVDAVIAAQQAEVDAWEQRKKGVMQKLFSQEVRFKADDGSDFPDWEEKTLGEITGLFVGKSFTSELNKNGRYVVMDMGSVSSDGSIIDAKLTDLDRDILRRGDLIMPKDDIGGGLIIGKTAYIPCDDKYVCGDHVYRLRFDSEIDGLFMHYEINSSGPQRRLGRKVTGSAQLGLNSKSVSSETVSVPSLPEQRKIADCLASMDEVIQKSKDKLAKWQELKKGLLQQMFV